MLSSPSNCGARHGVVGTLVTVGLEITSLEEDFYSLSTSKDIPFSSLPALAVAVPARGCVHPHLQTSWLCKRFRT